MQIQQGDVVFHSTDKIPNSVKKLKTSVVQEGEATGHAHRLCGNDYEFLQESKTKERFLRIVKPTALRHEEHKEVTLPPGNYRISIVREYDHFEEEAREVKD